MAAKLKMTVTVINYTGCSDFVCPREVKVCELTAKVPVMPPSKNEESYDVGVARSANDEFAFCENKFGGPSHLAHMRLFAVKDPASGALKIVSQTGFGKQQDSRALTLTGYSSSVNVLPAGQTSFASKGSLSSEAHGDFVNKQPEVTSSYVETEITFSSLTIEAP
jgi:hypothetical protein